MTTSSQHIEQVVEELQRKRYDYMRWAITGDGDGNKIAEETDTLVRHALTTHAAIVESETVEKCVEKIKSYHFYDWSSEQAIYEQLEEIIVAIRALQGKNEKI